MIEIEAATEGETPGPDHDQDPATAGETAEGTTAEDTLAPPPETDAAAAEATPVVAAAAVTTEEEADLPKRREALLRMTEETMFHSKVTTSESDL